jgi:hypothetical protein
MRGRQSVGENSALFRISTQQIDPALRKSASGSALRHFPQTAPGVGFRHHLAGMSATDWLPPVDVGIPNDKFLPHTGM